MSIELYNRVAVLKVGPSAKGVSKSLDSLNPRAYRGFRITFEIGKTSESNPNTAKISIYNLSEKSRSEFERSNLSVSLEVGYAGIYGNEPLLSQIFIGDVKNPKSERRGPDIITTFEAGDSEVAITETKVNESFAPNTDSDTVIGTLAKSFDVAVGYVAKGLTSVFQNGLSITGSASDNMDLLTKQAGLEWNVTDGELNVLEPELTTPDEAVLVSTNTGLIGIPSKSEDGIQFESLINPLINPGRAVSLKSKVISGNFKVRRCTYTGDTNQGAWSMIVEAK